MKIEYLADYPSFVTTVAQWHHETWGHINQHLTFSDRKARVERQLNYQSIPTIFVALHEKRPVGCASLVESDMSTRNDLSPWMASVYVEPDMRKRGIGSALVRRVGEEARALEIPRLYLYTTDQERLYASLGWQAIERCEYRTLSVVVMALDV